MTGSQGALNRTIKQNFNAHRPAYLARACASWLGSFGFPTEFLDLAQQERHLPCADAAAVTASLAYAAISLETHQAANKTDTVL